MFVLPMPSRPWSPEPPPLPPPPAPISTPGPTSGIRMPPAPTTPTPTPTTPDRPQDAAGTSTTPTPTPGRRPSIPLSSPPTRKSYRAKIDAVISPDPQTDVALFTNLIISGYEDSAARQITNLAVAMGQVANTNMAAYKPDREMLARIIVGGKPERNEFPLASMVAQPMRKLSLSRVNYSCRRIASIKALPTTSGCLK